MRPPEIDLSRWLSTFAILLCAAGASWPARALGQEDKKSQPFVNKIIITGNQYYSEGDLKKLMRTRESGFFSVFTKPRLDRDQLQRDIAELGAYYRANGFLDASVTLEEIRTLENDRFVDIIIKVVENEARRVDTVSFHNTGVLDADDLAKDLILRRGVPYNPSIVAEDAYSIRLKYEEKGYLAVEIRDSVQISNNEVDIDYYIEQGPIIHIRSIEIIGNKQTKTSIIRKEFAFKEGDRYQLSKILETQRNLFETGLFSVVDVLREQPNVTHRFVDLVVRVRERKPSYIEVGFGVGNILGSRISAEWGTRNFVGTGRTLRLKTEYSFALFDNDRVDFSQFNPRVKYYRYDAQFAQRRLFGTKLLFGVDLFVEKDGTVENLIIRTVGGSIGASRRFAQNSTMLARLSQERIKRESRGLTETSNSHILTMALTNDTRDFILDPRKGGFRDVAVSIGGGILGGDNDFYTISPSLQRYFRVWKSTILATRLRGGYGAPFGQSAQVPIENRYFTGGGNSVRGFNENSLGPRIDIVDPVSGLTTDTQVIGGRVLLLTNVELRFSLPLLARYRFSAAAFLDGGNVWDSPSSIKLDNFRPTADPDDVTLEDYRYSVGLGVRYNTPVGPIRLDYGVPIKRATGEDNARFHVSLGQIF